MGIFDIFRGGKQSVDAKTDDIIEFDSAPKAIVKKETVSAIRYGQVFSSSFDGEKNFGEIGPIKRYLLDYHRLSLRSWQSYLESDISKTVVDRYCIWIIDKGLKLQSSPESRVLESEGISIDRETFNEVVESRFSVWSKSVNSSMSGMLNFHTLSKEAFKNGKVGGDALVVLRLVKGVVKVQLIDGVHLDTPFGQNVAEGNSIVDGVEIDSSGRHIRYWVRSKSNTFKSIEAWSKTTGLRMAFLYYGSRYRLDNVRGVPVIATSLETLKKIDRYKEAAVGGAEERQKIALFIEHDLNSDGANPLAGQMASMLGDVKDDGIPKDAAGIALAKEVAATTNKTAFNMTQGSRIKSVESTQEMFFTEFYNTNANIVCASIGIPPNVAFSIYNDSFSASRAATKDWEHTITFERDDFYTQFYAPVYAFWLHNEILTFKVNAPGYLQAFASNNYMVIEAYLNCRFTGPMFPHIDPLKEVKAEREKLGELGKLIPLTTIEAATEHVGTGEYDSNVEQFAKEWEKAKTLGLEEVKPEPAIPVEQK